MTQRRRWRLPAALLAFLVVLGTGWATGRSPVSVGLLVEMARRHRPEFGLTAVGLPTVAGVLGVPYGVLDAG